MSTAITAQMAYARVQAAVEQIKNDALEVICTLEPGDVVRQGDVYLVLLDIAPKRVAAYTGLQLASGTTQGSRHVAAGAVTLYTGDTSELTACLNRLIPQTKGRAQLFGPVAHAEAPWVETHPEHGDKQCPAGYYVVTYQRTRQNTRTQD